MGLPTPSPPQLPLARGHRATSKSDLEKVYIGHRLFWTFISLLLAGSCRCKGGICMELLVLLPVDARAGQVSCRAFSEADTITPGALLSCSPSPHPPLFSRSGRRLAERATWLLGTAFLTAFSLTSFIPQSAENSLPSRLSVS